MKVVLFGFSLLLAIVGFVIVQASSKKNKKKQIIGNALLFQVFFVAGVTVISDSISNNNERSTIRGIFYQPDIQIWVNGTLLDSLNTSMVINSFKTLSERESTRSYPTEKISFLFTTKTKMLNLEVAKDSRLDNTYWVFSSGESRSIGVIKTNYRIVDVMTP